MSRKKVIVKRLNSIQNLGAMDVLCTDKTGTLTHGPRHPRAALRRRAARRATACSSLAYLNSHFQTGLKNVLDRAILAASARCTRSSTSRDYTKVDEIPFDFSRRLMSVVVETPDGHAPADLQGRAGGGLRALHRASSSTARSSASTGC